MKMLFPYLHTIKLCTSCLLLITALQGYTQNINNETNIFIPAGMEVHTNGSLTNTGFFQNNGSFFLSGDWTNTKVYQGTGIVSLEGLDQVISNNGQAIEHLIINGGRVKTIQGTLPITSFVGTRTGMIDFNNGVVKVDEGDTLILGADCIVNGGSGNSYVDGALITEGSGYKFFPVGKNGKYHPVELLDVTGVSPVIELEVQENLPVIQTSVTSTPMTDIYWTRKVISGTYEGSPITVQYNVREGIEPDYLVMLQGESLTHEFITRETTLERTNNLDKIESRNTPEGNIIVLAELVGEPPREYYFSTTLSPHATNPENRAIKIFGDNVTARDFRFQVFNRWGLVVYESSSAADMTSQGWDGKNNGNILPSGVYPYSLIYVDTTGKAIKRTGFITIIQ
jgi:gliding motility-associated-like protein